MHTLRRLLGDVVFTSGEGANRRAQGSFFNNSKASYIPMLRRLGTHRRADESSTLGTCRIARRKFIDAVKLKPKDRAAARIVKSMKDQCAIDAETREKNMDHAGRYPTGGLTV